MLVPVLRERTKQKYHKYKIQSKLQTYLIIFISIFNMLCNKSYAA